jgi:hypothetical protein
MVHTTATTLFVGHWAMLEDYDSGMVPHGEQLPDLPNSFLDFRQNFVVHVTKRPTVRAGDYQEVPFAERPYRDHDLSVRLSEERVLR